MTADQAQEIGKRLMQLETMPERCEARITATAERCATRCMVEVSEANLETQRGFIARWRAKLQAAGWVILAWAVALPVGFVVGRTTK